MSDTSMPESGLIAGGIPYLAVGHGPPAVALMGLTPTHEVPSGMERRMMLAAVGPLSRHFRVYVLNRKQGLAAGISMGQIAEQLARVITDELGGGPVPLTGTSTGGSLALQLAIDSPELVESLVVVAAAYRLGPQGRAVQQDLARLTRAGDPAAGWAGLSTAGLPQPLRRPAQPLARLLGRTMAPDDPADLLATIDAEDAFDVGDHLHRIQAPTLVIGGGKDAFYSPQLFRDTAAGIPNGRLHLTPGWGHGRTATSSATANALLGFVLGATSRSPSR